MLERDECVDAGYCTTCRKHIPGRSIEAHLNSSKHRWNTQFRLRKSAVEEHLLLSHGEGRLCDYLTGHHQPTVENVVHVSFRLLSGEIFTQLDVSMTTTGLLDCQRDLAMMLEVHPALIRIAYTGAPPIWIGPDAVIGRSGFSERMIDHCSLCFLYQGPMTECLFCGAYVCGVCLKCPNWIEERCRCWGCMCQNTELTPQEKARKLILGMCSMAQTPASLHCL